MTGQELDDHRVILDGDLVSEAEAPTDAPVVTIDPFVPSRYGADSLDGLGTFPTMTLMHLLKDRMLDFMEDSGHASEAIDSLWVPTEMLFEYYLDENWPMFGRVAKKRLEIQQIGTSRHDRSRLAYHALGFATVTIVGQTGERGKLVFDRFTRKHLAAIREESHRALLRARDAESASLERDVFGVMGHFVDNYPSWSMGRLVRYVDASTLTDLTLFRDEFTLVRDLYQQGFELACKCLWILIATQNTVKRGDPNSFGEIHPAIVPTNKRPKNLTQFGKLPNAYKLAYAGQVPGWDGLSSLLDNQRRNTIGHASVRHDLRSGRIVTDKDQSGISYLDFLNEVLGVYEALCSLMQIVRLVRVAASPDFTVNSPNAAV